MAFTALPAAALTITLTGLGGAASTPAYDGIRAAAAYWDSVLTNNVNVNISFQFAALPANVNASTQVAGTADYTQNIESRIANQGTSALDAIVKAHLPALTISTLGVGGINVITPGYTNSATGTGIDNSKAVYDTVGSFTGVNTANDNNNTRTSISDADAKALGYGLNPAATDATISFNAATNFDYNPRDGIAPGAFDFIGIAIHEIGHALGFSSGVDIYDALGTGGALANSTACGPATCKNYAAQTDQFGKVLDLFRYSNDPHNLNGGVPTLDWTAGTASYFSIDGGATSLGAFSTGAYNGDGQQASHWKDNKYYAGTPGCPIDGPSIGIMDPTFAPCQGGSVTALDIAAFDAIGWNTNVNVIANSGYSFSTAQAADLVPEPASWAMMLVGFGVVGLSLRRRDGAVPA